jgi:glycerol uptake facilitator-like aquaporin
VLKAYDRESVALATPPISKIIIFEAIGISLLTLGVNNSVYANIPDVFVATSLFVAIIFSGPFSGGHVNPAVTMGKNRVMKDFILKKTEYQQRLQ